MPEKDCINENLERFRALYPEKFATPAAIFRKIHRGDRIFISTACGEPQYLVKSLIEYVQSNPKAFFDTEVLHVWTMGVAPYTDIKFKRNFRHNSFFIGINTREAVNDGLADYTEVFLSQVPELLLRGAVPIDVALLQVSPPDSHGYMSLGISVDIVKAAAEVAHVVIAQVNRHMPRTHGHGFLHVNDVDFIVPHDEPLIEFSPEADTGISQKIGKHVASLVEDGDTIQVGYGAMPNAVLENLVNKKHLGVHTELISDGIVNLLEKGVVDNSRKTINRGKTIAAFCMGKHSTYEFVHDNPGIEFRTIDYTNNPLIIAQNSNMVAINSALEVDLTGQSTATSLRGRFFSGIGGHADFMRGAILAPNGRTILALRSTADNDEISRIVPSLREGTGVSLIRGDVRYVVTEYGIAYLHGKNVRERAMALIAIAHPKFREKLIEQAKERNLIYKDQAFVSGDAGEYPEDLETWRTTSADFEVLFRPVRISDEPLLKDFFYSLSDESLYKRFVSARTDMPHERLQEFVVIDYTKEMVILATVKEDNQEIVVGVGQYLLNGDNHTAEVAFIVRDDYQNRGVATALLRYLTNLAIKRGLLGFTSEVLMSNGAMLRVFEKMGFHLEKHPMLDGDPMYALKISFVDSN